MICPKCHSDNSKCIDSRQNNKAAYRIRRYECMNCNSRFTTKEVALSEESDFVYVIKDGDIKKI